MKKEITLSDLLTLNDEEILNISEYLGLTWTEWNTEEDVSFARQIYQIHGSTHTTFNNIISKLSGLAIIEFIREYHQMNMYTVNDIWCVQLLDLSDCGNDNSPCIYENDNKELLDVLWTCFLWVHQRIRNQNRDR